MISNFVVSILLFVGFVRPQDDQARDAMARLEKANRKIATDFYQDFFMEHDLTAIQKYVSDDYIQHNPGIADGYLALEEAAKEWWPPGTPTAGDRITIVRTITDGDLVWLHVKHKEVDGSDAAYVDVYRVKCGKIVEHWDVNQKFPPANEIVSSHPFF